MLRCEVVEEEEGSLWRNSPTLADGLSIGDSSDFEASVIRVRGEWSGQVIFRKQMEEMEWMNESWLAGHYKEHAHLFKWWQNGRTNRNYFKQILVLPIFFFSFSQNAGMQYLAPQSFKIDYKKNNHRKKIIKSWIIF